MAIIPDFQQIVSKAVNPTPPFAQNLWNFAGQGNRNDVSTFDWNSPSGQNYLSAPTQLGSWRDDWRANDPNYSFSMQNGWSYTGTGDAQRAQAAAAADALAEQRRQDDINRAVYDQGIGDVNSSIGRLGPQFDVLRSNYEGQYNEALSRLLQGQQRNQTVAEKATKQNLEDYNLGKTQAQTAYDTTKLQTRQDYVGAKNTIGSQAGTALNSLRRLLGSRGAGGGSAYNIAAPQAVARNASIQRSNVGQTFGRNQQALDTSFNTNIAALDTNFNRNKAAQDTALQNYLSDINTQQAGLGTQLTENKNALQAEINRNKADLLSKLSGLTTQRWAISGLSGTDAVASGQPYLNQANELRSQADQLGRLTPRDINVNLPNYQAPAYTPAPAYQAPDLSSYIVGANPAPTYQGQPQGNDYFSPYLAALLGRKRQTV